MFRRSASAVVASASRDTGANHESRAQADQLIKGSIPQEVWDRIVQVDEPLSPDLPVWDLATLARNPKVHKWVDTSPDGILRFFEALDQNEDKVTSVEELHVGFQRALNDFGMWSTSPAFESQWVLIYHHFMEVLCRALQIPCSSEAEPPTFSYEIFAAILWRLKMEILLKEVATEGPRAPTRLTCANSSERLRRNSTLMLGRELSIGQTMLALSKCEFRVFSYNAKKIQQLDITAANRREFFLEPSDPSWTMQWVVMDSNDRCNVLRLAAKYRLHPLHLEDVLKLETQQARFSKYAGNYFVIIPLLRLLPHRSDHDVTKNTASTFKAAVPASQASTVRQAPINIAKSHLAIFAIGPPSSDAVITFHGPWRPVNSRCSDESYAHKRGRRGSVSESKQGRDGAQADTFLVSTPRTAKDKTPRNHLSSAGEDDIEANCTRQPSKTFATTSTPRPTPTTPQFDIDDEDENHDDSVLGATAALLEEEYTSVRQGNSEWMLHALLENSVRMLSPVVKAYKERLRDLQEQLAKTDADGLKTRMNKPIMDIKTDLLWIQKRVKQLKPLIRNMLNESRMDGDVMCYVQGVDDEVEQCLDDIMGMLSVASGLLEEAKYLKDDARNETLKLFTVITTGFCPLQFLTGYFGMNFADKASGYSTIPMMLSPYGPAVFWAACIAIIVTYFCWLKFRKHWI